LTPIGLENPRSLGGLCLIGTSMDPSVKIRQAVLQAFSILLARHAIHPGDRFPLESEEAIFQQLRRHVMQ